MVQRIAMAPQGPEFSRFVMGYWRLMDWKMSPGELVSFIEQHLDLGVTTVDHADIYGDYQCEAAFGEALKRAPHLRSRMEIVSKCGIATRARAENTIGHYITDRDHIVLSAEQSLRNLATDHLDLLLIHRPDPLMDADEVAEAFLALHHSGKVRHFGVSNFTPAQFTLLQSRLPFTLTTNQVEISPVHQPLAARRYSRSAAATAYSSDGVVLSWRWVACLTKRASRRCAMSWRRWRTSLTPTASNR
ncbi:aldo/keto reductase [Klebsiella pneumoniae]|nr:aldo/keto reductase [Klebsiella pneumoniae]